MTDKHSEWEIRKERSFVKHSYISVQFSCSVMSYSAASWTAASQFSLSITISQSLPKLMSIESVMPSNHLILCHPLLLPPSIFPRIRVFSNESVLHIRWPKYWSFNFNPSVLSVNTQDWSPLGLTHWISLQSKGLSGVVNTAIEKHQFFCTQLSFSPTLTSIHNYWKNHSLN